MKSTLNIISGLILSALLTGKDVAGQADTTSMQEMHRPQLHFSPKANWVNDPNGMVYSNGIYHLFYQYYPAATIWGPMHWGHATSADLVHWKELPIALYPDSLGYIFSGSAVLDKTNSSGLGVNGKAPLVAMYTSHSKEKEDQKQIDFQTQSLAYSIDEGTTWMKYNDNPVIKNPGIADFRDPKVAWFGKTKKWIVTIAAKDHITFYSSPDLRNWKKESDFGARLGAHGGVWECPDLFPITHNGKEVWVLLVNLNPGGPNKGSATQYFLGDFDGHSFTTKQKSTKWVDYGPDEYAGITWSNTGDRKIFIGWMSNWLYANQVPTKGWRNGMTIPRELGLKTINNETYITSTPVAELLKMEKHSKLFAGLAGKKIASGSLNGKELKLPCKITLGTDSIRSFSLTLLNARKEMLLIGYDQKTNRYFIDRTNSGKKDFNNDFAAKHTAPRLANGKAMDMTLVIDVSSVELFADSGLSVMTELFFPNEPYTQIRLESKEGIVFKQIVYSTFNSIWLP